ncbi:MAG: hypothetical protein FWC58_04180 [Desulfobulbus sp.]|nr:hypothetical protein [Desulfobulbus sp.]
MSASLYCSFCGNGGGDVDYLAEGQSACICDRCVALAAESIHAKREASQTSLRVPQPARECIDGLRLQVSTIYALLDEYPAHLKQRAICNCLNQSTILLNTLVDWFAGEANG